MGTRATAQSTYTWNGTTGGAWYTTGNWTGGPAGTYPGTSGAPGGGNQLDTAVFSNNTATVGIDDGQGLSLLVGAINFQSTTSLSIGNSSAAQTAGTIQLNGRTVNAVANTLIAVGNTGANLTIANVGPSGNASNTLGVVLGIGNGIFNIYGDTTPTGIRNVTINSAVSQSAAGSGFTVQGGGNLVLGAANTFTGDVTITNGRVQLNAGSDLGTGAGKTVVASGGTLFVNAALTVNENIDFAGAGFNEASKNFGAIRISNNAVTLGGTLTMTGNADMFVQGNTTTVNGVLGETGGARNFRLLGAGTLAISGPAATYTGTTIVNQGILNLTGATAALATTSITVEGGGTMRVTNSNTANNNNRLPNTTPVILNNGTFNFTHNAGAVNYAEVVGDLTVSGGYQNIVSTSQAAAGQTSAVTFASLIRTAGGSVDFTGVGLGTNTQNQIIFSAVPTLVGGATTATGGIIGGWATYNRTPTTADYASYGANGVVPMGNVVSTLDGTGWAASSNLKFNMNQTSVDSLTAVPQVNSLTLILQGDGGFDTTNLFNLPFGSTLRVGSGGIQTAGNFFMRTTAGWNLTAGTAANTAGELIFNINQNTTILNSNITNNGTGVVGITKLGGGQLRTDGVNTQTGPMLIAGGTFQVNNVSGLGAPSSVTLKALVGGTGSTLNLNVGGVTGTGVTLNIEALITGGVSNVETTMNSGLNARSTLTTNSNNTWSGPIVLTGNHFAQVQQTAAANTLTLSGAITGPAFSGLFLIRGAAGGTVSLTGSLNLPLGTAAVTDGAILLLPTTATTLLGLNPQNGQIRLRGSGLLANTIPITLGQNASGNQGQFWLNGFNQTVGSLNIASGSTGAVAGQIVQNGGAANSVLTFTGGAAPSSFAGTVQNGGGTGTLGVTVTAGSLTLAGANTYTGGTTVSGGTFLVSNTTGSGTGTGTVAVSGTGTLGGTGTVAGAITVATGARIAPGTSPGILTAGANVTFATGSSFAVELNGNTAGNAANNHDRLVLSGTASTLALGNATLSGNVGYSASGADQLFIIVLNDAGSTITGTFNGIAQNGLVNLTTTVPGVASFTALVSYSGDSATNALTGGNDVVLYQFTPVPEPATVLGLAALGLVGAGWVRRRAARA